ncbi:precorrin-3B synthase [Synechococcus elongatus]|uniref:Ferredoxin--nitrite reductase n=2 Tax=Synechococcus elongatus TaxID=32046 RepID=Q31M38_SYNE7|nr:precorrin-3B synthase [Synechococcus elongatus]ABB57881.1 Ferredoxin--nitrite reductase [Synechococcus elongatus PCC 7942 = FACHB-805]AJD57637.1 precorrin-3B synthase [Synechococcus elongatus UTEX 2973]MBD2586597.1 precorrin-3B synthase [Synechococcus elongatus FACHB-242]MBD2687671.1 precorrin-3B synthase [Synechococcus elongatus FACHB-1061]MBD2706619.1 precorrin-3B synthase [Synechococcus elongatus PCC 7942 = FACHB-805]
MSWLTQANACPGVFYGTRAQDGFLLRIRIPAGTLHLNQLKVIANLLTTLQCDQVQVTNRANLQIRGVQRAIDSSELNQLQAVGLAATHPQTDHLRNLMASPTAGIDPEELLDTRPYIQQIDQFLQQHPEYGELSAKFSIGLDGGGSVGIGTRSPVAWEHRLNDVQLTAIQTNQQEIPFLLQLAVKKQLIDTGYIITPDQLLPTIATLTAIYYEYSNQEVKAGRQGKPRLHSLIESWGLEQFLQVIQERSRQSLETTQQSLPVSQPYRQFGFYPQSNPDLFYLGIRSFLGQITGLQLTALIQILEALNCQEIRLTPWQSLIVPNLNKSEVIEAQQRFQELGFATTAKEPVIIACAGHPVCQAAIVPTQPLAERLQQAIDQVCQALDPINIHISACSKFCAQSSPAEITILAADSPEEQKPNERYNIFFGDSDRFDRISGPSLSFHQVISFITEVLKRYQKHRQSTSESLVQFLLRSQFDLNTIVPVLL